MKAKIFLLVSLVLFAVQGWSAPPDSLLTRASGLIPYPDPNPSGIHPVTEDPITGREGINHNTAYMVDFDPDYIKPIVSYCNAGYEGVEWRGGDFEYMKFFYGCLGCLDTEDLLGVDNVFYLKAYQGNLYAPLTIEMIQGQGVFDFQKTTIYPWDLIPVDETFMYPEWPWSKWCGKTMTIGFHPTSVGTYTAKFKVSGQTSENGIVDKVFSLTRTVVEELSKPSIHITPSTIKTFECEVGKPDTQSFIVTAKNLTESLCVTIEDDLDWLEECGPLLQGKENEKQAKGRFRFKILGRETEGTEGYEIEKTIISAEEAAQGAILKISYNPTTEGGYHQAKAVISGNGLYNEIHLRGYSSASQIHVSDNFLLFNAMVNGGDEKNFTINGTDLTSDSVHVDLTGEMFSLWFGGQSDCYPANMVEQGVTIWVEYKPTESGTHEGTITISGGGAIENKTIHLIGTTEEPIIIVDPSSLEFPVETVGKSDTLFFKLEGINLIDDLTLNVEETESGFFTIPEAQKRITPGQAANGVNVAVTYKPTSPGTHGACVSISGGGAERKTVILNGSAVDRYISTSESLLDFGTIPVNRDSTQTFSVTASNLTGPLSLTTSDATNMYTISPTTITAAEAAIGKTVTVKYKPTAGGNHNVSMLISGGGADSKTVSLTGKCASITTSHSTYDFGTVNVGEPVSEEFTVTGTNLSERITIRGTETIGGDFSITPEEWLPASGGTVTITYNPVNIGSTGAVYTFSSGDVSATISVEGTAVNPPTIGLGSTSLDFDTVALGQEKPLTFTVYGYNLTGDLTLSSNSSQFTISPTRITAAEAAAYKTVTVTYKPTAGGNHNATVTISGGGAESRTVSLTGKCASITCSPSTYNFGSHKLGESTPKAFTVTGTNLSERIIIRGTETIGGDFSITPKESLSASGGTVTITYSPVNIGSTGATYTFSSGDVSATISVEGTCINPSITVDPTSLNFGTVIKGQEKPLSFTVTGTDLTGNLTLTSSHSFYTVTPTTITPAQAKAGKTVTVKYKPTASGTHNGAITISGGGAPNKTVGLTGKCINPTIDVSPQSLNFGTIPVGSATPMTLMVYGSEITGDLIVTKTNESNCSITFSPTIISVAKAQIGAEVTVICTPSAAGSFSGTIKISGGDAAPKTVSISGAAVKPSLTVSKTSLSFLGQETKTFTVKGTNLTGNVTLTLKGNGKQCFTVSPTSISKSAATSGATVTVTCNPNNLTYADAEILISSPYATSKTVSLVYASTRGSIYSDDPEDEGDGGEDVFANGSQDPYGNPVTNVHELQMGAKVYAKDLNIIIESPIEQSAVISDIAGHAWNVDLQKGRNEIPVNASGVFIVRIREKTTKLLLK